MTGGRVEPGPSSPSDLAIQQPDMATPTETSGRRRRAALTRRPGVRPGDCRSASWSGSRSTGWGSSSIFGGLNSIIDRPTRVHRARRQGRGGSRRCSCHDRRGGHRDHRPADRSARSPTTRSPAGDAASRTSSSARCSTSCSSSASPTATRCSRSRRSSRSSSSARTSPRARSRGTCPISCRRRRSGFASALVGLMQVLGNVVRASSSVAIAGRHRTITRSG